MDLLNSGYGSYRKKKREGAVQLYYHLIPPLVLSVLGRSHVTPVHVLS